MFLVDVEQAKERKVGVLVMAFTLGTGGNGEKIEALGVNHETRICDVLLARAAGEHERGKCVYSRELYPSRPPACAVGACAPCERGSQN